MPAAVRTAVARTVLLALTLSSFPALAAPTPARIEGLVVDSAGTPAAGYEVLLVEPAGQAVASATTDQGGLYSFREVAGGSYAMGLRDPRGGIAPVLADPVRVEPGSLVRRDIALHTVQPAVAQREAVHYGLGEWWVSRTRGEKTITIAGFVGGLTLLYFLLENDNKTKEQGASPSSP